MSSSAITGPILADNKRAPAGTAAAPSFAFNDSTGTGVYLVSPGVLGLSTAGVQRVVVDSAGNVGIGTASPGDRLHVSSATTAGIRAVCTGATGADMRMYGSDGAQGIIGTFSNHVVTFYTNSTEKMRIAASGDVLIGTTSFGSNSNNSINVEVGAGRIWHSHANGTASGSAYVVYQYNGTIIGSIAQSGTGNVVYNTGPSDYRLKEEVKPFTSGLQKVLELKPVSFKWKESQKEDYGFIAHELQEVIPEAVTGQKDAVNEEGKPDYQAIFPAPAQMIATLVAAIQELEARLAALESK